MQDFDQLWNYSDPAATELKFREVLNVLPASQTSSYRAELLTQIARTYSLRYMFKEAHAALEEARAILPVKAEVANIRYFLEKGRTLNYEGKRPEAKIEFLMAEQTAGELNEDFYRIDALHMLAIGVPPQESIRMNEMAIIMAEKSEQPKAKDWLGSLYNNLGWSYFDTGNYEKALSVFLRALQWRIDKDLAPGIFIAKWCVARTLRALNQIDKAITIQLALFEESTITGHPDGFVHEELGELFLIKSEKQKAGFHFEKAYSLLSTDPHLQNTEKGRLERLKRLADGI